MAAYELIITDVTCYGSLYCVAGWDLNSGRMIRPEPATANSNNEASRFWASDWAGPGKFFSVGNVVRVNASPAPQDFPFPHATEDRLLINDGTAAFIRHAPPAEIAELVADAVSPSLAHSFGQSLVRAHSGKAYVPAGTMTVSLDAVEVAPEDLTFYEDSPAPGKRRLRARIRDEGVFFDLSVPADAARTRFFASGTAALAADAQASDRVHVRLGLCRPFAAMPDKCYAQVNGLFFLSN